MALEENLTTISLPAQGDLSTKQYYMVYVNSSGQATLAAEGSDVIGILQNDPAAANRAATVGIGGVSKVAAGGSVTAGQKFTCDANGKAGPIGSSDDFAVGIALETFSNGGVYKALIQPRGLS